MTSETCCARKELREIQQMRTNQTKLREKRDECGRREEMKIMFIREEKT